MKNRRNVCAAKEAGLIEYPNLPGAIKTGCQSSPLQTSKYCFHHAPRVGTQSDLCNPNQVEDVSTLHSRNSTNQEGIVSYIIQKKEFYILSGIATCVDTCGTMLYFACYLQNSFVEIFLAFPCVPPP